MQISPLEERSGGRGGGGRVGGGGGGAAAKNESERSVSGAALAGVIWDAGGTAGRCLRRAQSSPRRIK